MMNYTLYDRKRNIRFKNMIRSMVRQIISEKTENYFLPGLKRLTNKSSRHSVRILWFFIIASCVTTCIYQIGSRITYYLSHPTAVDVRNDEIIKEKLPKFTFCARDTEKLVEYLKHWPEVKNSICYPDMVQYVEKLNMSVDKMWELVNTSTIIRAAYLMERNKFKSNLTIEDANNIDGICSKITHDDEQSFGDPSLKMRIVLACPKPDPRNCPLPMNFGIIQSIKKDVLEISMLTAITTVNTKTDIALSIQQYQFLNSKKNPCVTTEQADECERNCEESIYNKYLKNCRFPFMVKSELPFCNSSSIIALQLYDAHREYESLNSKVRCNCTGACERISYLKLLNSITSKEEQIELFFQQNIMRTMVEKYAYDIVSLLCDIGGNIGLFLGLSCLTFVKLIGNYFECWKNQNNHSVTTVKINSIFTKTRGLLNYELKKRQSWIFVYYTQWSILTNNKKFLFKKLIFGVIRILTVGICVFQTVDRVVYYLSSPTFTTVRIVDDNFIQLPFIVTCAPSMNISMAKVKFSYSRNISCERIDMLDLLDVPSKYANNIEKLWAHSATISEFKAEHPRKIHVGRLSKYSTIFGNCTKSNPGIIPYTGSLSILVVIKVDKSSTCNCFTTAFFVPPGEQLSLKNYIFYPCLSRSETTFVRQTMLTLNTKRKQCASTKDARKCEKECFKKSLLGLNIQCKLPVIKSLNISLCNTSNTAKIARDTYIKTNMVIDPVRHCGCKTRCNTTVFTPYTIHSQYLTNEPLTIAIYRLHSNIHEIIEQRFSFPLIKMLCDIGSTLGFMLGVSLLSMIEIAQYRIHAFVMFATKNIR